MKVILLSFIALNAFAKISILSVYDERALGEAITVFTSQTGIEVELISKKSTELLKMLPDSDADLYLDKDVMYMNQAQRLNVLEKLVPDNYEVERKFFSTGLDWMLFFYRTRTLIYNKDLVNPAALSSYFDLGDDKFNQKVCMRESKSSYNQAWAGYMLANFSAASVFKLFSNLSKNAVRPLYKSDRDMIRSVGKGECLIALVNSYYLPGFLKKDPKFPVGIKFVNEEIGTHVNGLGLAILKNSKNKSDARKFIQFMTSVEVQNQIGQAFEQYPVNPKATLSKTLKSFGNFNIDTESLSDAPFFKESSLKLMQENNI